MATKFTFWCRYEVSNSIPDEHMVEKWPRVMKGWISGYADGVTIWCARVDAKTPEDAERVIRGCYGELGARAQSARLASDRREVSGMTLLQDFAACVFLAFLAFSAFCLWISGKLPEVVP